MISKRTVLILGAGASAPYDYPLGSGLGRHIIRLGTSGQPLQNLQNMGFQENDIRLFSQTFARAAVGSIDAFLAQQPQFVELGKCAIADYLVTFEKEERLFNNPPDQDHWYQYLWERLRTGARTAGELANNNLSIVTFNYDRSLDMFLLQAVKNFFGISDLEASESLASLRIIHVYGSLGGLPISGKLNPGHTRPYLPSAQGDQIKQSANSLHLIAEDRRQRAEVFQLAQQLCFDAEVIGVLGFGFDSTNCAMLDLKSVLEARAQRPAQIVMSVFDATNVEVHSYKTSLFGNANCAHVKGNSLTTLRESGILLPVP